MSDGKINGYDAGSTNEFGVEMWLEERPNGAVAIILNGGKFDNAEALLTPQQCRDFGELLVRVGLHALTGMETEQGFVIREIIRKKLQQRVLLMSRNWTEKGIKPERIAQEAVDIVLNEVT